MITVKVFRENNKITAFELSGHANSGPYGYDLVCAGVSAVSFGAVIASLKLWDIELHIEQAEEGVYLYVKLPPIDDKKQQNNTQLLLEGMLVSLRTIERDYSEFIKILVQ